MRGPTELLTKPGLAVVGTRHPTPYGSGMAERLACDLAGFEGDLVAAVGKRLLDRVQGKSFLAAQIKNAHRHDERLFTARSENLLA